MAPCEIVFYLGIAVQMALTQRERYLAMGVGLVVGLFGAQYAVSTLSGQLQAKQALVDAARKKSDDINRIVTSGKLAANKIEKLSPKSLPTQQEQLVAQYRNWLTNIAEQSGMSDIQIKPPVQPADVTKKSYLPYNFALSGICRSDQAIELVAAFYQADYLHTIKNLKLTRTKEPNVFEIVLDAQALALKNADPKQEPTGQASGRLAIPVEEYKQAILNRNPFSPPNNPPRFTNDSTAELLRGESWSLSMGAKDDEQHLVAFELASDDSELPEGLRLSDGTLSWRPQETGTYQVKVRAKDNGWPSKSTETTLRLTVVEPPPPEQPAPEAPKFDVATQAFVSALLSGRGGPEAWIRSRTEGKTHQLNEGAEFEIGSVKARVVAINLAEDFVELETNGTRWTIGMDTSLADAFAKSQID
jgi:hypothetical protein